MSVAAPRAYGPSPTLVLLLAAGIACTGRTGAPAGVTVNDVQSQINSTLVHEIARPTSIPEIREIIRRARAEGLAVSITGGRHAMGGQQFGSGTILMDMSRMNRVLRFDSDNTVRQRLGSA